MQKMACLMVITISLGLILSGVAVTILYAKFGFPIAGAGLGFLGIVGLGGLGPWLFKKDKGKIAFDERDSVINRRSALAGFAAAYLFMGLACMIPFFVMGPDGQLSAKWLPMIFMGAGISNFFFHSLMILIQYGRTRKGEES
jgi:hypothetical protein